MMKTGKNALIISLQEKIAVISTHPTPLFGYHIVLSLPIKMKYLTKNVSALMK